MWSNASIARQHDSLNLKAGEKIEVMYVKDYKTTYGGKGRDIRIGVDRKEKK